MTPTDITASEAVARLSVALGEDHLLVGPLSGGETGATAIEAQDGCRMVLKWELDLENQARRRQGVLLADRLRTEARWPVPRQHCVVHDGCLLVVQELMDGDPVDRLTHRFVDDVIEAHERRLGLARSGDVDRWGDDMIEILIHGGNGYCLHEPLRRHDTRTRRIVERIEELGAGLRSSDLGGHHDIVHGDLHPGNMLQHDGRLAAIVDLDFTRIGDAAFDLSMLALTSLGVAVEPGVRSRLFALGLHGLPEPRRSAYVANLVLRFLDWPIRKGRPDEIEFWVAQAQDLLPAE